VSESGPGIAQARKESRPHRRPPRASRKAGEVLPLNAEHVSHLDIARRLGVGRTSKRRIVPPADDPVRPAPNRRRHQVWPWPDGYHLADYRLGDGAMPSRAE
jgi:hypothetical protein